LLQNIGCFKEIPFAEVLLSWLPGAKQRLLEKKLPCNNLFAEQALASFEHALVKKWSEIITPSMFLELSLEKVSFTLQGENEREEYLDFIQRRFLDRDNLRIFFEEYRGLSPLLETITAFWINTTAELLVRLEDDLPLLAEQFNRGMPLGQVERISLDEGDAHDHGRSVSILTFACGISIIYKPKNLTIGEKFNTLLDQINALKVLLPLKSYKIVPRGGYAWEEKVEGEPCAGLAEVERFFQRTGMLLGLCYAFNGADFHSENIIASGEYPVLIDLETLLHSQLIQKYRDSAESQASHSVLSVGLLPGFLFRKYGEKGIDLSGVGNAEPSTREVWVWKNLHTARMKKVREKVLSTKQGHQVIHEGSVVLAKHYIESIILGFQQMYQFIQEHQDFWLNATKSMESDPIRIVVRSTPFYAYLLEMLYEPHCFTDPMQQDEILKLLSRRFGREDSIPTQIIEEEKNALLRKDIPYFHSFPFSQDLYVGHQLCASGCLETMGFKQLSMEDFRQQEVLIRAAFQAQEMQVHTTIAQETSEGDVHLQNGRMYSEEEILTHVRNIAEELLTRAIHSKEGSLGWIHFEPRLDTDQYQLQAINESLYSGKIGIALFFLRLCLMFQKKQNGSKVLKIACNFSFVRFNTMKENN